MIICKWLALALLPALAVAGFALTQSGSMRPRAGGHGYGVNLTFVVYQYDATRSSEMKDVNRVPQSYANANDEMFDLKEKYKLEELAARHVRSVGLTAGEPFTDAVLLGPEYMVITVVPGLPDKGHVALDVRVRYANAAILDAKGVELDSFETGLLRGGKGMFGAKYFVGTGGRQESAPIERTLLVSVTPEIVPANSLRNRPEQLSHPVDENGVPVTLREGDKFTPPVVMSRVVPKFDTSKTVHGSVLLSGIVSLDGKITNVQVVRSIDADIDQRAVDAFRQFKFSPALLNGKAVTASYREDLSFAASQISTDENPVEPRKLNTNRRRRFPFP